MKKSQVLLTGGAILLLILLLAFGRTAPEKAPKAPVSASQPVDNQSIKFSDLLSKAKTAITPAQAERLLRLENSVARGDVQEQQLHVYHQLARFWSDSVHMTEPYAYYTSAYYTGEAAKLENSEKSLTFAAHLFLDNLMTEGQPAVQKWLAGNAKVLFDKAIAINPNNDSSRIGLGAVYMFGNISDNPMQGILPVREIAQKDPGNVYAQMILGLGGKKSGQYDKAIERFKMVVDKQPENMEAIFNLAESYDLKGDKPNAIKWYETIRKMIKVPEYQKEIDSRITELKK